MICKTGPMVSSVASSACTFWLGMRTSFLRTTRPLLGLVGSNNSALTKSPPRTCWFLSAVNTSPTQAPRCIITQSRSTGSSSTGATSTSGASPTEPTLSACCRRLLSPTAVRVRRSRTGNTNSGSAVSTAVFTASSTPVVPYLATVAWASANTGGGGVSAIHSSTLSPSSYAIEPALRSLTSSDSSRALTGTQCRCAKFLRMLSMWTSLEASSALFSATTMGKRI
mmetsp:Transcript_6044/g.16919  ORF Transcript_6044/g.16919 Transcript_6044/m.16919 type:complete len:225 (-) Transcript_6044:578-1252(-)